MDVSLASKHTPKASVKAEACSEEEEEEELPSAFAVSVLEKYTMPQFLAFKKNLKAEVGSELAKYASTVRGKNWNQLL